MESLARLTELLENGEFYRLSQEDLGQLFNAVRDNKYSIYVGTYRNYMLHGGPFPEYFDTECVKLAREAMTEFVNKSGRKAILLLSPGKTWPINARGAMYEWDKIITRRREYNYDPPHLFLTHCCLRCGRQQAATMLQLCSPQEVGVGSRFGLSMDLDHIQTALMCVEFLQTTHRLPSSHASVASICKSCHKACACGAKLHSRPSSVEEMVSFVIEGACLPCMSNQIIKLPLPKPSTKELRAYRGKLITMGREVIK